MSRNISYILKMWMTFHFFKLDARHNMPLLKFSLMMSKKILRYSSIKYVALTFLLITNGCMQHAPIDHIPDQLQISDFENPPAEARPFVRWWWNGNQLEKNEIVRHLNILKEAGIGGVEINPIAMPEEAAPIGTKPLTWLSKEWNEMLKFAALEAQSRGMIADLIVGSGWPFGGEFLSEDETIQRIIIHKIQYSGGQQLKEDLPGMYKKAVANLSRSYEAAKSYEMVFVRLVPENISSTSEIIELSDEFKQSNQLDIQIPSGKYHLVYGILQKSNREVMHGAPGAAGPVMDHYKKEITQAYLNRLNKISQDTGTPLSELVRALFCDSIELDGANWTDDFADIFFETYNYRLEPWFPFVFYDPYTGYSDDKYNPEFQDQIRRVRFDYNQLLVKVFLKNFTREFQDFCTENGVLCRYQAYGVPFLMGMMEGNMIADIPESNNWIYSADMDADEWKWNQGHGYMTWNMYAASGGHLTGRKIISNEAMTNTQGVFKTSLEEIKQHDDMNFITGMNHAVLHGFNYSPSEAGFPGWIRYGSYFSEQNSWWPYFKNWAEYNARLSYVFQNSEPVKNIAILAPETDIWAHYGLTRGPFHTQPWYVHRLWEPISQAGSSCDYISQNVIRDSKIHNGKLTYGPMSYQALVLSSIQSINPQTALKLLEFVKQGGKIVAIDNIPDRSPGFQLASHNDSIVNDVFTKIQQNFKGHLIYVDSPSGEDQLLEWTTTVLKNLDIQPDVYLKTPNKNVFQIRKKSGDSDIWFFVNSNRSEPIVLDAVFPTGAKTPWVWNPETGKRSVFPWQKSRNELTIELAPLQSLLLVFEPKEEKSTAKMPSVTDAKKVLSLTGPWELTFHHINGETFKKKFDSLKEFGTSSDNQLNEFAGTVTYSTHFSTEEEADWLELGKVNKGVTEVWLNGKNLGLNWYGKPIFPVSQAIKKGENRLEIKYTSVLSNYAMSLEKNPTAKRWTAGYQKIPIGLEEAPAFLLNEH